MHSVFIDDKQLSIGDEPDESGAQNIEYEGVNTFSMAENTLHNSYSQRVHIFGSNPEGVWNAFKRRYQIVEAAGGIVRDERGALLMIKRLGRWDLPKGKIAEGERADCAALREVREETGISELEMGEPAATTYHTYIRDDQPILKPVYWFHMSGTGGRALRPQTQEGIEKAAWLNKAEIEAALTNTHANIKALVTPLI